MENWLRIPLKSCEIASAALLSECRLARCTFLGNFWQRNLAGKHRFSGTGLHTSFSPLQLSCMNIGCSSVRRGGSRGRKQEEKANSSVLPEVVGDAASY